ncbi:MAG: hypothetical protein ACXW5U_32355 [Thermoanaerobaculia bacterium]
MSMGRVRRRVPLESSPLCVCSICRSEGWRPGEYRAHIHIHSTRFDRFLSFFGIRPSLVAHVATHARGSLHSDHQLPIDILRRGATPTAEQAELIALSVSLLLGAPVPVSALFDEVNP